MKNFWYGYVLNPWSYALLAIFILPIIFFFILGGLFYGIQSHPEKIGGFFGKIVAGFEEQRNNYNSEVRCSIRADSYDCKTIDTYFDPKDKKTNEKYCKKDEVALFSEPSGGDFVKCFQW